MEFTLGKTPSGRELLIEAQPGEYDAQPLLERIQIDAVPLSLHPDRLATALCLLFGRGASGSFTLPAPGCAQNVALAIERFNAPTRVGVAPVNLVPNRVGLGGEVLRLACPELGLPETPGSEGMLLSVQGPGKLIGMMATLRSLTVGTNALVLGAPARSALERILPALGIAVLFCEDLQASSILLPRSIAGGGDGNDASLLESVRQLLDASGLKIAVSN